MCDLEEVSLWVLSSVFVFAFNADELKVFGVITDLLINKPMARPKK